MKYLRRGSSTFSRRYSLVYSDLSEMIEVGLIRKKSKKEVFSRSMHVNLKQSTSLRDNINPIGADWQIQAKIMFITKLLCIHNTTTQLYQLILQNIDTAKLVYSEYKEITLLSNSNSLNFHSEFVRNLMANFLYNIELKVVKTILTPSARDFNITFSFNFFLIYCIVLNIFMLLGIFNL